MKLGYHVQGAADEAFVYGLAERWCPGAELAPGKFRGRSKTSLRREIKNDLHDLRDNGQCDVLIVLTDSDTRPSWRDVKQEDWRRVPDDCRHMCVLGVAERNIECWLAIDRSALAKELGCAPHEIPTDNPAGFVKRRFGLGERDDAREDAKRRVSRFVADAPLKSWIERSDSFEDFYQDAKALGTRIRCDMPNERESG